MRLHGPRATRCSRLRERGPPRRVQRLHRRLHDRLERLLEVQGLRDRLGDPRERLQLRDPPLGARVELRVLDRLRNLRRRSRPELDLGLRKLARLAGADVERAFELVPREDRHREDRLVLVLGEVREELETRVEMSLGRDHDRGALRRGHAGDAFSGTHPRRARHLFDAASVRRAEDELAAAGRTGRRSTHRCRGRPRHFVRRARAPPGGRATS